MVQCRNRIAGGNTVKKIFNSPELTITEFDHESVLTTSAAAWIQEQFEAQQESVKILTTHWDAVQEILEFQ